MAHLVDVNFLIALCHAGHAHSARAVAWLEEQDEAGSVLLCRVAQMGLLRILTHSGMMKTDVQPAAAVWEAWDLLLSDERFLQITEPPRLEERWRRLTRGFPVGRRAETDTYFAAFALAGGHRLVTFDRGFRRYPELDAAILE